MNEGSPARDAWTAATELLRAEGKLSDSQTAFVRMVHPLATVDEVFMIGVGSDFVKDWITNHVSDLMIDQLSAILGRDVRLMISVDPALSEQQAPSPVTPHEPVSEPVQEHDNSPHRGTGMAAPLSAPLPSSSLQSSPVQQSSFGYDSAPNFDSAPNYRPEPTFREEFSYYPQNFHEKEPEQPLHGRHDGGYSGNTLSIPEPLNTSQQQAEARLNPRYTFDSFVTGESNRFAHATALAVSEAPGSTYNPLFLYSDSGMGKTHLLHAIGNYTLGLYPNKKVMYVSAEEFTNAFINSVRDSKQQSFKDQFRNCDVLLIDDIQFIANFATTVEEFFHTFNALSNANKQIVITSDVAPQLLTGFEERMISRFASGITANIDLPNLETRIAILDKKAAAEQMNVGRNVLEFIASRITTNVREMEGALRRVTAFADLSQQPVTLEITEMVLKDIISDPDSVQITAGLIMAQTSSYFSITIDDLKSPARTRTLTTPRHIGMYLCRELTDLSLPKIAETFDRRDHTTVMNALKKIDTLMAEKQTIFNQVTELTQRIKQAAKDQANQAL